MPYIAFLHTHSLLVILYIFLFFVKLVMLFAGSPEKLERFRRRTKIAEMILPTLFLITGVVLAIQSNAYSHIWFWVKMAALVVAIVLGILTFKKNSKLLGILTLIVFVYIFLISYSHSPTLQNTQMKMTEEESRNEEKKFDANQTGYSLVEHGKFIYTKKLNCEDCHGENGDKGLAGAGDLRQSQLNEDGIREVVLHGRKNMPAYKKFLDETELNALVHYVKSLRVQ